MLPSAYIFSKEEILNYNACRREPIHLEEREDIIADLVKEYPRMFSCPALYVGKKDPVLFLHYVINEMRWLNYFCQCLPISMFWTQKQLGASGPFSILRGNLSEDESFAAIKKLAEDHLEWIPKHLFIKKWELRFTSSSMLFKKQLGREICPELTEVHEVISRNKWHNKLVVDGPSYCAKNIENGSLTIWVLNREIDPIYWWDKMHSDGAAELGLTTSFAAALPTS